MIKFYVFKDGVRLENWPGYDTEQEAISKLMMTGIAGETLKNYKVKPVEVCNTCTGTGFISMLPTRTYPTQPEACPDCKPRVLKLSKAMREIQIGEAAKLLTHDFPPK